ncbi:hypothetical protein SEA_IZZY_62 [Streptomyces phage Izzy]|uniref:Uncharacterized protein n=5 Tax=Likavirus izzy TaxID=1982888 RepID=A0A0K1Y9X1_9CAUD|nr:hypothetical protein AVT27_gp62 [Streptomyces phage Izzy]ATE85015.1 hypothetical protein SEA_BRYANRECYCLES_62 [Streptomyces phage BryanRecycles]ATE85316.1 hypothetical protein SEA_JASH_62 [Streptomyces phage Jash]ATE85392.1 hypothetical protein SEA_OLIYNYK_62 [Streptomyces phage Oliynyk]QDK03993.1 hypothetical protein SEA_RUSTICUS_62 [Streptomyces phage Rusticus]AKY03669.1 hypothetical protein SEA_IZZY_62 [Streptomyces phage Izzy]
MTARKIESVRQFVEATQELIALIPGGSKRDDAFDLLEGMVEWVERETLARVGVKVVKGSPSE